MAVAFGAALGSASAYATGAATYSFTTGATVPAGAKIIFIAYWWDGGASNVRSNGVSDGAAYTLDRQTISGDDIVEIWYRDAAGGLTSGTAITITMSSTVIPTGGLFLSGFYITGTALGGSETGNNTSTTGASTTTGSISNISADAIYCGVIGIEDPTAGTSSTQTNGTEVHDMYNATAQQGAVTSYLVASTVASRALTGTLSNAGATLNLGQVSVFSGPIINFPLSPEVTIMRTKIYAR